MADQSKIKLTIPKIRNKYAGKNQVACVLGCGPSLKGFDLKRLCDTCNVITVGTNRIGLVQDTDYWIASEQKQVFVDIVKKLSRRTTAIVRHDANRKIEGKWPIRYTYDILRGPKLTMKNPNPPKNLPHYAQDFERGLFLCYATVIVGAIELCRFLGINEVFLFGVDLRRGDNGAYYFRPEWRENLISHFDQMVTSDDKTMLMIHHRMRKGLQIANDWLWRNMDIVNVSPGTNLDVFPVWSHEEFWRKMHETNRCT